METPSNVTRRFPPFAALAAALLLPLAPTPARAGETVECAHCLRAGAAFMREAASQAGERPEGARIDHAAPERPIDVEHILLRGIFPDLRQRWADFSEVIVFSSLRDDLRSIEVDAVSLRVSGVARLDDKALRVAKEPALGVVTAAGMTVFAEAGRPTHFHDGRRLTIRLDPPLRRGERTAIRIDYRVEDPRNGLNWIVPDPADPDRRAEVWSQGQPESNRFWFAAPDYPNDFHTTEQIITVPNPNRAIANGRLLSTTDHGDGTTTFHYRIDQPHVSYLTSLIVGQFARGAETQHGVELEYFVPPEREGDIQRSFGRTGAMLGFFNRLLDEPYPYQRYAQTIVRDFTAGGMENVSATTLVDHALLDASTFDNANGCGDNSEALIAHELAHQWFGDLITCRNWTHLWLNEGWASYCEALWFEESCGRDAYEYNLWRRAQGIARNDSVEDPAALVWTNLPKADSAFGFKGSAVYNKGAYVLHMLRQRLGTERFFKGTALYIDRHKFSPVVTDDFRRALEEAGNDDLELWFRQWIESPGTPQMRVSLGYDAGRREASVTINQTQKIDFATPAFFADAAVVLEDAKGNRISLTRRISGRSHTFTIPMDEPPALFAFDPDGAILKGLTLDVPIDVLAATALRGPTAFARLDAISALGRLDRPRAIAVLEEIARDDKRLWGERSEALLALGGIPTREAAAALVRVAASAPGEHRVRRALAEALGRQPGDVATAPLLALSRDPADVVARQALEELGRMAGPGVFPALEAGYRRGGNNDRVRRSALIGLGRLGDPLGIPLAAEAASPGSRRRTRTEAITALGSLLRGVREPDPGHAVLMEQLRDPDERIARAAAAQIGEIRWRPARHEVEKLAQNRASGDLAEAARNALRRIDEEVPADTAAGLRTEVLALRRELEDLRDRADKADVRRREALGEPVLEDPDAPKPRRKRFLGIF